MGAAHAHFSLEIFRLQVLSNFVYFNAELETLRRVYTDTCVFIDHFIIGFDSTFEICRIRVNVSIFFSKSAGGAGSVFSA